MPSVTNATFPTERRSDCRLRRHRLIPALRNKRDSVSVWLDSPTTAETNRKLRIRAAVKEEIFRHKVAIIRADLIHNERRALMNFGLSKHEAFRLAREAIGRDSAAAVLNERAKRSEDELD
ncbi:Uncharacterised protein [uncultured archaeon]|nr:Uncharacterised protein [uncultured archaeon]